MSEGQIAPAAQLLYETHAAFRYVVEIPDMVVGAFTECTLPVMEIDTEEVREGGLNTYTHLLPGRRKSARLTLKNGVGKSQLMAWYIATMKETFAPKDITITLRDARGKEPICIWNLYSAYPVKWTGPQLQADSTAIAIQTLEFACGLVEMVVGSAITD
ncbi:MAG: phage tail protein [Caldilineaceae bacterium]